MLLSILVPIYKNTKSLELFLNKLKKQTQNNYEVIFVVDTNDDNPLLIIDKYISDLKGKVTVIYNSRRQGHYYSIKKAITTANCQYSIIFSITDAIKENFVEKLNFIIEKAQTDIIEFNANFYTPISFDGELRYLNKNQHSNLIQNVKTDVFAYTYPFYFNKVFKNSLLKQIIKSPKINTKISNSRFSVEIIFKSILLAKSYYGWNEKLIKFKNNDNYFNSIDVFKEWKKIIEHQNFKPYHVALKYNKYFSSKMIYQAYASISKNSHMQLKLNEFFEKMDNEKFFDSNIYVLKKNKETDILKKYKTKNSYKAYKEI